MVMKGDLSEFEYGMVVCAKQAALSLSKTARDSLKERKRTVSKSYADKNGRYGKCFLVQ